MMFEKQKPYRRYTILVWGIVLIICAIFTYVMQLSMPSDSSYAFFFIVGPIFLVIGIIVVVIGIIKASRHKE